jgi:tol-pal system protein YbgF
MTSGSLASRSRRTAGGALLLAATAFALASAGCAPSGYYRSTTTSLDSLVTLQGQQQKRLASLEREIASTRESIQATRASSDTRLSELNQRMDMLQGKLEESGMRFSALSVKMDAVKQKISASDSMRVAAGGARDSTAGMDPEEAYQTAYSDLASGRYGLAKAAFTEYLRRYPGTEVSDNAQYWIGECDYALGDFQGAIEAFKKVVEDYPKGDKVRAALLKTGIAYARLRDMDSARKYYTMVITRFPRSDEARLARERLAAKSGAP